MTNGGTGPYKNTLLLANSGRGDLAPSLTLVDVATSNVTVLLEKLYGRQFNSLNDVKIHPSGTIFFYRLAVSNSIQSLIYYLTFQSYGYLNNFRPEPLIRSQVYCFDPATGLVRFVADDFFAIKWYRNYR